MNGRGCPPDYNGGFCADYIVDCDVCWEQWEQEHKVKNKKRCDTMTKEFYCVEFYFDGTHYNFHNKDNAFDFLWQEFLNCHIYDTQEEYDEIRKEMYQDYFIEGFGRITVQGFED